MYSAQTKKFYYSFFFILPFLIIYEIGLWQNILGSRLNGADAILRYFFYFIFSVIGVRISRWLLIILILLALGAFIYYLINQRIKINIGYLGLMLLESLALAALLAIIVNLVLNRHFPTFFSFMPDQSIQQQLNFEGLNSFWAKVVASIGAGVFEELLFRVILLRFLYNLFTKNLRRDFGDDFPVWVKAISIGSLIFTAMHFGAMGSLGGYLSIFIAAILLSLIYIKRGYGLAAATHAFYDIYLMFGIVS